MGKSMSAALVGRRLESRAGTSAQAADLGGGRNRDVGDGPRARSQKRTVREVTLLGPYPDLFRLGHQQTPSRRRALGPSAAKHTRRRCQKKRQRNLGKGKRQVAPWIRIPEVMQRGTDWAGCRPTDQMHAPRPPDANALRASLLCSNRTEGRG